MKIVFAGTPEFAAVALAALIDGGHELVLVLTQPDRPSGRGLVVAPSPVKRLAAARGIPVLQPRGLRIGGKFDADARAADEVLRATPHDAMIVAAYGLIVPPLLLALPRHGCINVHASLLPRWRGAAPIQRAIAAGDTETGITIMQMDAGLDTGPMLLQKSLEIAADDTAATLTARLAVLGGETVVAALPAIEAGLTVPVAQDDGAGSATYAAKLTKSEAPLDFDAPTRTLVDRIRAFDPWPGCSAVLVAAGEPPVPFKIWKGVATTGLERGEPGRILGVDHEGVTVATADGAIRLAELQKPGGRRVSAQSMRGDFRTGEKLCFVPLQPPLSDKD